MFHSCITVFYNASPSPFALLSVEMWGCEPHQEPILSLKTKGKTLFFVLCYSHCWSILCIAETGTTCRCWRRGQVAGSVTEVFVTCSNGLRQPQKKHLYNWGEILGNSGEQLKHVGHGLLLLGNWSLVNLEIVALFPQLEPAWFVRGQWGLMIYKWPTCEEELWGGAVRNCFCTARQL